MNVISISKKHFQKLEPFVLSREVCNTEGKLYFLNYHGEEKILKKLFLSEGPIFANKLYTIELLDNYREYLPENFCLPDYLLAINGSISGFTTPYKKGTSLTTVLKDQNIDFKEQVYYLKRVGELLTQLSTIRKYTQLRDIFINDLHDSNFIVDLSNKSVTVIDLDSCKIGSNDTFPSKFLVEDSLLKNAPQKYLRNCNGRDGHIIANEQSDSYCYNIMLLNYLFGENINGMNIVDFYDYLNYLEYIGIDLRLLHSFESLVINRKNENPESYLETLTRENIFRAKKNVYKKVKKR